MSEKEGRLRKGIEEEGGDGHRKERDKESGREGKRKPALLGPGGGGTC